MSGDRTPADLKAFALLSELSSEDRDALYELLEAETVRKGRSIYRETAEADGIVLIVSGSVGLSSGSDGEFGALGAGDVLGAASVLSTGRREATAKALTDCDVLLLARTAYRRLLDDHPRAAARLTEAIANHLAGLLREAIDELRPTA